MPRRPSSSNWIFDLAQSASAVFVVNARRQFQLFNAGCEQETGWSAADIHELRADYVTEADVRSVQAVAAALAPPPQVWHGEVVVAAVDLPHRSETPRPRLICFFPMQNEARQVSAVLGVIISPPAPQGPGLPVITSSLHAELASLRQQLRQQFGERTLLARTAAMLRVLQQVKVAQATRIPVLIRGEPGTGKEHIARVIHYGGNSGRRSFVPFDCRHIDSLELQRTLRHFAEERLAEGPLAPGTLYFAHIDAAPSEVLERIAEFAEEEQEETSQRIIVGSVTPLERLVDAQRFPQELYYRLTTLVIDVPPLRERLEELALAAQLFLEELNRDADQQVSHFHDSVLAAFRRYHWPGNLDELRLVVVEARQACDGPVILPEHLPFRFRTGADAQKVMPRQRPLPEPLAPLLERVEREQLELALMTARGNVSQAAELLGISRARLYRRMQHLGVSPAVGPMLSSNAPSSPNAPLPSPDAPLPSPNAPLPPPNAPLPSPNAPLPSPDAPLSSPDAPLPSPDAAEP
uniref:Sigma-54-dependent Fis family transcriptional regulator n=1 Tax=Schlesneria paludicola TaxID=360056 RepID=A0A7C4QPG5_9PLAN